MGLSVRAWQLATVASLGLAAYFALRPIHPASAKGRPVEARGAAPAQDAPRPFWGVFAAAAPADPPTKPDRTMQLLVRLSEARTVPETCTALGDVARLDDTAATQAIVDVTQRSTRSDLRTCATTALGRSRTALAASWLEELVHDRDTAVRDAALLGLAGSEDESVRRVAVGFAHADDPKIRQAALVALGNAHVVDAASLLGDAIAVARGDDRTELIAALGATRDPAAVAQLTKLAGESASDVRSAAISALASAGGSGAVAALNDLLASPRAADAEEAVAALGRMTGDGARASLLAALSDPRGMVATAAIRALADDTSDDVAAALRGIASRPGPARETALEQMIACPSGAADARTILIHEINVEGGQNTGSYVRLLGEDSSAEAGVALAAVARRGGPTASIAADALAGRDDPASRRTLTELAADGQHPDALLALGRVGDDGTAAIALVALRSGDGAMREAALTTLASIGGRDAEREIANAAASPDVSVRSAAAAALAQSADVSPALRSLAEDANADVARNAFGRLAALDPTQAETVLEARLGSADEEARTNAIWFSTDLDNDSARPLVISALHDPSATVVAAACSRLAEIGGADAQSELFSLMTNPQTSPQLAGDAANALSQLDGALAREQALVIARYRDAVEPASGGDDEESSSDSTE